ncbi:MAG: hypothetical protein GFGODING_02182 [Flavobacteriales bacterium]|nr:hypothetical protein [Flavobacteriales bacterium]
MSATGSGPPIVTTPHTFSVTPVQTHFTMESAEDIIVPVALFAMVLGIVYVSITARHRQRMAMIEKGMDPRGALEHEVPMRGLRNGLFLLGIGLGLGMGSIMEHTMYGPLTDDRADHPMPYFISVLVFGGAALIAHHLIVRRKQQG